MDQVMELVEGSAGEDPQAMSPDAPRPKLGLTAGLDARLRGTLVARVQTAHLLQMGESRIAELVKEIEDDPLFRRLIYPGNSGPKIVRFQPHPRTRLAGGFYELHEHNVAQDAPPDVVGLLEEKKGVYEKILKMGREKFELYFLRADTDASPRDLADECGISEEDVQEIQRFVLSFSIHAEFFDPSTKKAPSGTSVVRLARLQVVTGEGKPAASEEGEVHFELLSPLLARGRYDIHYDRLQELFHRDDLPLEEKRRLKALVRRLELINWRQNATFRILDLLTFTQRGYLKTRDALKKEVITQRQMARRLSVAPSTINRAIQRRSVVLPWEEEVLLEELFCSRKDLCLDALDVMEVEDPHFKDKTDHEIQENLQKNMGFVVPRRTVNRYRQLLATR